MRSLGIAVSLVIGLSCACAAGDRLVVHEWGTFTSFQNEAGESLRRINTDDEPVPRFVHRMVKVPLFPPTEIYLESQHNNLTQGAPHADPRVTMRLETPVVYFHLPPDQKEMSLEVAVDFRGGYLTEYFPKAAVLVDGKPYGQINFPAGPIALGGLRWSNIHIGDMKSPGEMPQTTDHVWLAPRKVDAAIVTVGSESERFLFYRGVGDLAAPLTVTRNADQVLDVRLNNPALKTLKASTGKATPLDAPWPRGADSPLAVHPEWDGMLTNRDVWLLDVRPNGTSAFRRHRESKRNRPEVDRLLQISGELAEREYSPDNLAALRAEMHEALVREGLFADEANALLETWELSYFRSPGQRLFFLVPRAWTEAVLPLKLSVPADVTRVMVGRIELVTPRQRSLLKQLADTPVPDLTEVLTRMHALRKDQSHREDYNALASGRGDSSMLGADVPPTYQAFLDLGRFRTSLLMDAADRDRKASAGSLGRLNHLVYEMCFPGKLKRE
ncbi:MAG: hypothetical protein JWP89_761 [Schlesneria sp.]|nr:hypothetical protein [Schlesneria sp.]